MKYLNTSIIFENSTEMANFFKMFGFISGGKDGSGNDVFMGPSSKYATAFDKFTGKQFDQVNVVITDFSTKN